MKVFLPWWCWDRMKHTLTGRPTSCFTYAGRLLSLTSFSSCFFQNSGHLSASLTKPCRPLAVGFIQLGVLESQELGVRAALYSYSPSFLSGRGHLKCASSITLTLNYSPCATFSEEKTKNDQKKLEDWQSSVKVFWTEKKVCNWGPWRESSLYVKKNYSWRFCFVEGLLFFSKHRVISLFFNFQHHWTPFANCMNTTCAIGSLCLHYYSNFDLMNAAFASMPGLRVPPTSPLLCASELQGGVNDFV